MPQETPPSPEFPVVRRGFDPDAVAAHLAQLRRHIEERVASAESRYSGLETELAEARKREEAVHLTLVAATKTKEELLVNAQRDADEKVSRAKEEAESLLAEAKKEAFRLMADARKAAEETTAKTRAEVEALKAKAEAAADATRDAARREAIEIINAVESDTASVMAARDAAIENMRSKYEEEEATHAAHIDTLRATAADLEARLKAIAAGTLGEATTLVAQMPEQPAPAVTPPAPTSSAPSDASPALTGVVPKARWPVRPDTAVASNQPQDAAAAPPPQAPAEVMAAADADATSELQEPETTNDHPAESRDSEIDQAVAEAVAELAKGAPQSQPARKDVPPEPPAAEAAKLKAAARKPASTARAEAPPASETTQAPDEPALVPAAVGTPSKPSQPMTDEGGTRKGSYYSRRSAKLPRIGTEAGRSALAAANAIRGATRGEMPEDDDDVTAQTA